MGFSAALAEQRCIQHLTVSNTRRPEAAPAFFNIGFRCKGVRWQRAFPRPLAAENQKLPPRHNGKSAQAHTRRFYKPPGGPNKLL